MRNLTFAAAALLALAAGGRAAGDPVVIKTVAATGDRFVRTYTIDIVEKWKDAAGKPSEFTIHRDCDAVITVVAAGTQAGSERIDVEFTRSVNQIGPSDGGKVTPAGQTGTDPMHGTTVRYDRTAEDWTALPIGGPTPNLLLSVLGGRRADPLRRALVPQGESTLTTSVAVDAGRIRDTIADQVLFSVRDVGELTLRSGGADDDIALFSGRVKCQMQVRIPGFPPTDAAFMLDVNEDVGRADGIPRRLSTSGSTIVVPPAGASKARVEVSVRAVETTKRLDAAATVARGPDAWKPYETLVPALDDRRWFVAFHRMQPEDGNTVTERIIEGEKVVDGTHDGWTEMVTVNRFPFAPGTVDAVKWCESLHQNVAKTIPTATWKTLPAGPGELVYEWALSGDRTHPDQHTLGRVITRPGAILHIMYCKKVPQIPDTERTAWLERLTKATIEGDR